jgi:hypothetical protein
MQNENSTGITLAVIAGVCMVLGAVILSNPTTRTGGTSQSATAQPNVPERQVIQNIPQTNEGIPEWQAKLLNPVNTTANNTAADPAGTNTLEAVANGTYERPDTLTANYGAAIAEEVMQAEADGATEEELAAVRKSVQKRMLNTIREGDELYTVRDLNVVKTSDQAIRTYGNTTITIVRDNPVNNSNSELDLLRRGLRLDDASAYQELAQIATTYGTLRDEFLATPVPTKLADAHLKLINSYHLLHNSVRDMARAENDMVRAYVRSEQFQKYTSNLLQAYQNMGIETIRHRDKFESTDPALLFAMYLPDTN